MKKHLGRKVYSIEWDLLTTGKPVIPDGVKKEAGLLYHHRIIRFVEEHGIPSSLVMNFDQAPPKYAPQVRLWQSEVQSMLASLAQLTVNH